MSTIVGIATAPGIGGIGIIRMSGEKTFEILDKIMIDFNLEHPSNKLDDISFNSDGNLIVVKLIQ